jgi:hypothetical protein
LNPEQTADHELCRTPLNGLKVPAALKGFKLNPETVKLLRSETFLQLNFESSKKSAKAGKVKRVNSRTKVDVTFNRKEVPVVERGMYKMLLMDDKITGPFCVLLKPIHIPTSFIDMQDGPKLLPLPDPFELGEFNCYLLVTRRLPLTNLIRYDMEGVKDAVFETDFGLGYGDRVDDNGFGLSQYELESPNSMSSSSSSLMSMNNGSTTSPLFASPAHGMVSKSSSSVFGMPVQSPSQFSNQKSAADTPFGRAVAFGGGVTFCLRASSAKAFRDWTAAVVKQEDRAGDQTTNIVSGTELLRIKSFVDTIHSAGLPEVGEASIGNETQIEMLLSAYGIIEKLQELLRKDGVKVDGTAVAEDIKTEQKKNKVLTEQVR